MQPCERPFVQPSKITDFMSTICATLKTECSTPYRPLVQLRCMEKLIVRKTLCATIQPNVQPFYFRYKSAVVHAARSPECATLKKMIIIRFNDKIFH